MSALALAISQAAVAETASQAEQASLEHVVIVGSQEGARKIAGSAFVVDNEELAKFEYSDINRILRQVPGVYALQEEGFGLRPNIGIRGAGGERSAKITLMEDGVLIAPAPYAGPSAYYFPTAGRIDSVEVLKGAETVQYGPYTVGGAVNLISTPIPTDAEGMVQVELGENGEQRTHAWYGASNKNFGALVETHQHTADGFKTIDRSNTDTGFTKRDYMVKLRANTNEGEGLYQQLDLKLQRATETSNQSYLGLTDADFNKDEDRRYGLSALDQMDNKQEGVTLSHLIKLDDTKSIKTTAYYNYFERDWYKLSGGGSLVKAANAGDANAQGILDGSIDTTDVKVKHNAREYKSYGIQSTFNWKLATGSVNHDLDVGVRLHEDEVDRFQPSDYFNQVNGSLVYDRTAQPGSGDNRLQEAQAMSAFVVDHIAVTNKLDVTAGLRYETVETKETRYADLDRNSVDKTKDNDSSEWLPALGATYQVNDQWSVLGGVHRGFAPADGGGSNIDPELSTNYEAGVRFAKDKLFVEAIGFYSDYENSVKNCTVASPCELSNGDEQESGSVSRGEAEIKGLELAAQYDLSTNANYMIPVSATYTYTDTEITSANQDGDADVDFQKGDILAYVPENQFAASVGFVAASGWDAYLNASYTDEMCIDNTCERSGAENQFKQTESLWVFDLSASYPLNQSASVYAKVDNLLDKRAIISRSPDGARGNKPRTAYVGITLNF